MIRLVIDRKTTWGLVLLGLTGACGDSSGPPPPPPPPPPASPHHLTFGVQPASALANSTLSPAITVEVRDSIDRRITSATIAVTVAVAANPGAATLSGTATNQAINGVATFSDLNLNQRGRGYTLRASSGTLVPDTSLTFDVYAPLVVDAVAAAESHTCALKRGVATYCWGQNTSGQLGDSTTTERLLPVQVKTDQQFDTISASAQTSCGITAAGVAYCWGSNFSGRLGDSTLTDRTSPTLVAGGLTWREVFVGFFHSCGLATSGKAYCWGYGNTGQLGDSTMPSTSLSPKAVVGGLTFDVLHGRNFHNCGLASAGGAGGGGNAYCWGTNNLGVLGDSTRVEKAAPQAVYGGQTFLSIAAGFSVTCGIATDAETYCWGSGDDIGDSTNVDRIVPTRVHGGHAFVALDAYGFVCALTGLGAAWCWGSSFGSPVYGLTPVAITQPAPFVSISVGYGHTCGVTAIGALYCWGDNRYGQLGDGTKIARNTPVRIVY